MTHTRLWLAASILAGIILVIFFLSVPHTRDIPQAATTSEATPVPTKVSVHDVYKKGTHTLTGTVQAPNPCTTLSATATTVVAASTSSILVTISMPEDAGICLQQITQLPFSTTVAAPANVPVSVTVNGTEADVTHI